MTFYEIGVMIALFLLLYTLFVEVIDQKIDESNIFISVMVAILLSLLSWGLVFYILVIVFIDISKNKRTKNV